MHYISLGYFCSIAMDLEKMGLRSESSPFDWLISDFEGVILTIQNHFEGFLDSEYLAQNTQNRAHYKNVKYDCQFFHDFNPYQPLHTQLPSVQAKYSRRIQRFYKSITEPTLFIRYINDKPDADNTISKELQWIEENHDSVITLLKSFNDQNDILFIANDGVTSQKIKIHNVSKDDGDNVARSPLTKSPELKEYFNNVDFPQKQLNIERYLQKQEKQKPQITKKILSLLQKVFLKEYIHTKLY